ncbi:hypothetical protein SELMODRAFT_425559 [Selaginella moellendorffii]|uniref:Splicing factor cactin central domain-containing protein n=1 Tax=Selaginella moellendorffii TaxID=88036 RepID=D8STH7_SELML|nr:hypothetical protein SELMODRAFT_425559 [Selaginella moellendorffii]
MRKRGRDSRVSQYTEEEIHDYLVKKAQRKAAKVAKKLKSQSVSGYSDDSNPFGDSNLTEKKKIERDIANKALNLKDISVKAERVRQEEQMKEIEKVKKKREERAMEKAKNEEEKAMLAREREKKEEEIRIKEGRATKIDLLSKLDDLRMAEPYHTFKGLSVKEVEKLREKLRLHLELDRKNTEFWEAMTVVCNPELA